MSRSAPIHTSLQAQNLKEPSNALCFFFFFFGSLLGGVGDGWGWGIRVHWLGAFCQRVHVHMHALVNEIKYRSAEMIICP